MLILTLIACGTPNENAEKAALTWYTEVVDCVNGGASMDDPGGIVHIGYSYSRATSAGLDETIYMSGLAFVDGETVVSCDGDVTFVYALAESSGD